MHMKSSTGLDGGDFGKLHSNILKKGIHSILEMKPKRPTPLAMDKTPQNPFLPHLAPGTNPLLQFALSPVVNHGLSKQKRHESSALKLK